MLPYEIQLLLLAMAPISELRGAIPIGYAVFNLPFWEVFLISFFGNLVPVIFLLLCLEPIANFLSRHSRFFKKFFDWLFLRTRKKIQPWVEKYGKLAIIFFVALPLPITGGWTGAIVAFLFGMPFIVAFPLISLGVLIAGGIVSSLTLGGIAIEKYFGWPALIIIITILVIIYFVAKRCHRKEESSN
jgi:uncharacterized membrane protein